MSNKISLSVITPAYNCENTIEQTILCVSRQRGVSLEHIIIDDGSTDSTFRIAQGYLRKYPHIILLQQENRGAAFARNRGMEIANGKYIAFLDADDYWDEEKMREQIHFMEANGYLFTYGEYMELRREEKKIVNPPAVIAYDELLVSCPIGCLTVCYNQAALGKQFMPLIDLGQDWGLWLKMTRHGLSAYKYPGLYAYYRASKKMLSRHKLKKAIDLYQVYRQEEHFGILRSLTFLIKHCLYVWRGKKYAR